MIKPTVGRIMWYWPKRELRGAVQPLAAIVTYVHDDNMVDVFVFRLQAGHEISVPIVQDGSPYTIGDSHFLEWMPYQISQAKRHEEEGKSD